MVPKVELAAALAHLSTLMSAVARSESPKAACESALFCLQRALHVERASVLLFDDLGVMRFVAWRGLSDEYRRAVEGHSPWTRAERDPPPILVSDAANAPAFATYRDVFRREAIAALAFIPLCYGDELLGKFMLYYEEPHDFSDEEIAVVKAIAGHVAFAVEHLETGAQLRRSHDEARRALRSREDLIAIVSHDLRVPLSVVSMKATMLMEALPAEGGSVTKRDADVIVRNTVRMDRLIRDLLDVSQIEAGELRIDAEASLLFDVVRQAMEASEPLLESRRMELICDGDVAATHVLCDRERLLRVFDNLVSNAIKFTPPGGRITISVQPADERVVVAVEDTGAGIAPDHLPHVFDRYWQADEIRRPGVGLGLYITKALVQAQGGEIWAKSTVGQGTTVYFSIPRVRE